MHYLSIAVHSATTNINKKVKTMNDVQFVFFCIGIFQVIMWAFDLIDHILWAIKKILKNKIDEHN